jgi:hypothetical protein
MTEQNPATGQPLGGRDDKPEGAGIPGERPEKESVGPPADSARDDENASRAATGGPMASDPPGDLRGSEGIPERVEPPSPAGATDADPPGGSVANQDGRAPDQ